jgi:stage V sporulation protein G
MHKKNQDPEYKPKTTEMPCLIVTGSQVFLLRETVGKTKALARVVLNEQLQMTGIRIVEGANGLFVAYPNDPGYKGDDYRSLFYPITRELRDHIEALLLEQYHQTKRDGSSAS